MTTATIVITDSVGSTALRERLGDMQANLLRREHDQELGAVTERHGGRVVKGTGDGLVVAFPAASDGVAAAIAMQTVVARLQRRRHEQPPIRIGISAGDVTWEGSDCFGMPVVEAARLCDLAGPSQIVCSGVVAHLTRGKAGVLLSSLGAHRLKGLDGPVEAFEIAWSITDDSPRHLPFVGRSAEVDAVGSGIAALAGGRGRVIMVSGEPGIGKTALVAHATTPVPALAFDTHSGHCFETESIPYAPWIEIISSWSRNQTDRKVTELLARPAMSPFRPDGGDRRESPLTVFDVGRALADAMRSMAATKPLVLIFQDLHWADRGTLDLLGIIGHVTIDAPITIIGTYRDTEVGADHPLTAVLAALYRSADVERVHLGPLTIHDITEAVALLGGRPAPRLIERIASETGGNALFVREVLLDLRDQGTLADPEGFDPNRLPDALKDIVRSRVARLTDHARALLSTASLFPRGFDLTVAGDVAGLDQGDALNGLDEARTLGLVTDHEDTNRFTHDLIRQALVADLGVARRTHLHAEIAARLESTIDRTPLVLAGLIHHYSEAGNERDARRCLIEAGAHAEASFAFLDAVDFYGRAAAIDDPTDGDPNSVTVGLARSYAGAGYRLEAAERFIRAAELEPDQARALTYRRDAGENLVRGGRVDIGNDLLIDTAKAFGIRVPVGRFARIARIAFAQIRLGFADWESPNDSLDDHGRAQLEFCGRAYRGLRHVDPLASSLITSRYALLALRTNDRYHRANAAIEQAVFHAVGGTHRPAKVDRFIEIARREAETLDDPRLSALVELVTGTIAFLAGDFAEVVRIDEEVTEMLHALGGMEGSESDVLMLQNSPSLFWLGRIAEGEEDRLAQTAAARARGDVATPSLSVGYPVIIRLLFTDSPAMIGSGIDEATARWHQGRYRLHHVETLIARAEMALYTGNGEDAVRALEQSWSKVKKTMLLNAQYSALTMFGLLARANLAVAAAGNSARLAEASRAIGRIRKERAVWGNALADLYDASLASLTDPGSGPADLATAAATALDASGLALCALSARYRAAQRRHDRPGMAEAASKISGLGVANPERAVEMLAPGWQQ